MSYVCEIDFRVERNKQIVKEFYEMAFNEKKPEEAIARYVGSVYRQHNPTVGDGPEAFIVFLSAFTRKYPQLHLNIKRIIAERDLVVTHSHLTYDPQDRGTAVADIFRVKNGKIVEHWDVMQQIPKMAANNNTMF